MKKKTKSMNLMPWVVMLWLSACTEQPWSVTEYRDAQVNGLRVFCEGRDSCLADLNEQARKCEYMLENLNPDGMTDQQIMTATMEFTMCMTAGVDERFIARMNELVPVKETGTMIRVGPDLNDPGVLQISLFAGEIRVAGALVDEARFAQYLEHNQLAQRHHKVALLMNKDDMADVGLMITVMDQLKAAGLDQISVVPQ
jgi:hypothetical protein